MLPAKHRLTYQEFRFNPHRGQQFNSKTFLLTVKKTDDVKLRFVILVPKTLEKRSTRRNRCKRIITEIIRQYLLNNYKGGAEIMIRLRRIILKEEKSVVEELIEVFKKAGIYYSVSYQ